MDKLTSLAQFHLLDKSSRDYLIRRSHDYHFSSQEFRTLCIIGIDLKQWGMKRFEIYFEEIESEMKSNYPQIQNTGLKNKIFESLRKTHEKMKLAPIDYSTSLKNQTERPQFSTFTVDDKINILGTCPVYSDKTVCCNLKTIDAVESCAFDCSYCSIQSFYHEGKIGVHRNLKKYLDQIVIDPLQTYHFGTGQSSDSLFWQNKFGALKDLFDFANKYPNVIIELKTKSDKIDYLLENDIPKNVITTWSINPQIVIENEEHYTADLSSRLAAARKIADKKNLIGFHFHPMFNLIDFENHYTLIAEKILLEFSIEEIALVSMGTLTFTKKVMSQIRARENFNTQVLKLPETEIAGKFSYNVETKANMFQSLYLSFKPWHQKVFFYLCMENQEVWNKSLGFCYQDNFQFEKEMHHAYFEKINFLKNY